MIRQYMLVRGACNDPGRPSVAYCTVAMGPTLASAIDYRSGAILRLMS